MRDEQKIINVKTCVLLLLLISIVTGFNSRFQQPSHIYQRLQDLFDDSIVDSDAAHQRAGYKFDSERDHLKLGRRFFHDVEQDKKNRRNEKESYLELRTLVKSTENGTGYEITLQNGAVMNTRLRVLYIDTDGYPSLAETGRLWMGQTKSVKLPNGARNVRIIVEKDYFFENWNVAYNGTLSNENQCIRITGVTFFSTIKPCS